MAAAGIAVHVSDAGCERSQRWEEQGCRSRRMLVPAATRVDDTHRQLTGDYIQGLSGLTLSQSLAQACNYGDTLLYGCLGLAGNDIVGLTLLPADV